MTDTFNDSVSDSLSYHGELILAEDSEQPVHIVDKASELYVSNAAMIYRDAFGDAELDREVSRHVREGALLALTTLKDIAKNGKAEQARVAAARGLAEIARLIGASRTAQAEKEPESMDTAELHAHLERLEAELSKRAKPLVRPSPPVDDVQLADMLA